MFVMLVIVGHLDFKQKTKLGNSSITVRRLLDIDGFLFIEQHVPRSLVEDIC